MLPANKYTANNTLDLPTQNPEVQKKITTHPRVSAFLDSLCECKIELLQNKEENRQEGNAACKRN